MNRTMSFALRTRRPGQTEPSMLVFASRDEMRKQVAFYQKHHFVGSIEPLRWNEEFDSWDIDQDVLGQMSTPDPQAHKVHLAQAAKLFSSLAKKDALSNDEMREVAEVCEEIVNLLGITAHPEEHLLHSTSLHLS